MQLLRMPHLIHESHWSHELILEKQNKYKILGYMENDSLLCKDLLSAFLSEEWQSDLFYFLPKCLFIQIFKLSSCSDIPVQHLDTVTFYFEHIGEKCRQWFPGIWTVLIMTMDVQSSASTLLLLGIWSWVMEAPMCSLTNLFTFVIHGAF